MSFNYTSPFGIRLTATEEQLLEKIDNFQYPLHGFSDIGGIHNGLRGDVVLSNQRRSRHYSYEMTVAECMAKIKELDVEIQEINDKLSTLHTRYEEARNNHDDDKANRLEEEMGYLGRNRQGLESTKEVYQEAISNGKYKIEGDTDILGEYDSTSNQVILYYKSISSEELLAVVYVHEMMHAYLDGGGITLPEIEEPIVEYGMLCFFKAFGDTKLLEFAQEEVKNKQNTIGLAHYGFGHCIFLTPNRVDWLDDYRNAKNGLAKTDHNVAMYLDYWKTGNYPEKKEKGCMEALYKVLHHGSFKKMKVVYEQSKDKNDLIRKLDNYLVLHSPIAPLAIALNPSVHEDRLYRGWEDSSARQYYDWLDPTRHPELIPLLNKHGLYGSIYNCVDLQQIAKIYKELVDKKTPEAQNAYGNNENMVSAIRHFIEHLLEINNIIL